MYNNFEVYIEQRLYGRTIEIFFIYNGMNGNSRVGIFDKDGKLCFFETEKGEMISKEELLKHGHTIEIPMEWGIKLRDTLIEKFGEPKKQATEQELKATKFHLDDMRKLVFKKDYANESK